jgi:serpin B
MRRSILSLGLCALVAVLGCRGGKPGAEPNPPEAAPPVEWSADMQAISEGHNRFAFDLYAQLVADEKQKGKNVFFSPYSVHTALAMTATGAKGATRDQMVQALHLPAAGATVLSAGDIGRYYNHPRQNFELSVANALWGRKGFPWRAEWISAQNERFGAGFQEADFRNNPDAERERINKWVEEQTRNRIKELLLRDQITRDTTMVLTNAIYFKGKWVTQFDPAKTAPTTFHCADDSRVQVPMMHTSAKCGYAHVDDLSLVELPYQGGELSMVAVLPRLPDGLPAVEKKLSPEVLAKWLTELRDRSEINVSLPKFTIETRYELPPHLEALGMTDAFDRRKADFTGMSSVPPGYITDVAHKAFVEVNEEGTTAAAATAVVSGLAFVSLPSFYANHPFLFLIRDTKHGTILFLGRVEKP